MSFDKYLLTVRKLNNMERWATEFMHQRTTVSEHSFFVAQIGQMLGIIEEHNGNIVNWKRLYSKLLNHDVTEAMTGDIISTTKHKNKEIKAMVERIEQELVEENLINTIDEGYRDLYRNMLLDGKDSTLEGRILTCADSIDALIECINEIKLNNCQPFEDKYYSILKNITECDIESGKYFLESILPGLLNGCDKIMVDNDKQR